MPKRTSSLISAAALLIVLWLIWQKLRILVVIAVPWWGFLIMAVVLFLAIDYALSRLLSRTP